MDRFPPVGSETGNELPQSEGGNPSCFWNGCFKRGRVWDSGRKKGPEDDPGGRFGHFDLGASAATSVQPFCAFEDDPTGRTTGHEISEEVMPSEENGVKGGDLKVEMGEYRRAVPEGRPLRFLDRRGIGVDAGHGATNTI